MKKFAIAFAVVGVFGLSGCGKSACDQVADETKAAYDAACSGKNAECWYCDCYNQSKMIDVVVDGTSVTYSCKAIPTVTTTTTVTAAACEGSTATTAQACIDAKQTCIVDPANSASKAACDATKK
jgi:hypothetical protein